MLHALNWVDYAFIAVILISAIIGIVRGFIREAISLLFWILSFWTAFEFANQLSDKLSTVIKSNNIRYGVSFFILFIVVFIIGWIINVIISKLINKTPLKFFDRILGFVFGALRGGVVIALFVLIASATAIRQQPDWQQSQFLPYIQPMIEQFRQYLPTSMSDYFTPEASTQRLSIPPQ